jgi:hypothetical protein
MTQDLRKPLVELIEDVNIRESLTWLYEYLIQVPILRGAWRFVETEVRSTGVDEEILHGLTFTPKDVILTNVSNGETVTFSFEKFNDRAVFLSASGPCVIRFFVGRYIE